MSNAPMQIDYGTIEQNVARVDVQGSQVRVSWKDPLTGAAMGESSATMSTDQSMGGRVQASVKRSLVNEVASGAMRFVGGLLGGSAGRVVRDAAYTASSDIQSRALADVGYTDATKREAVVRAFAAVQSFFVWDERSGRFVGK